MVVAKIFAVGIIGGLAMTVSMYLIHFSKLATADMVVALGSILTKRKENSFVYGSIIHIISGIVTCGVLYFLGVYYKLAGYTLL